MSSSERPREIDPLLRDLSEKKQRFRRNVVSLAAELKEVRGLLASQELTFARESLTRQEAEAKAKNMEEEICRLQKSLEERNGQIQALASTAKKHLEELDDLRSQLSATKATAGASALSAQSAQFHCLALLKELNEKNSSLKEHEVRMKWLGEQLDLLQKDLQARESSQNQLKDEVLRIEHDIMQAIAKAGASKDCELRKILDEISPENFDKINNLLTLKDEEIVKLRDEIRIMFVHWKLKAKELESQANPFVSRTAPLDHQDLMREVYQAVTATGKHAYNTSQKAPIELDELDIQEGPSSSNGGEPEELQSMPPHTAASSDSRYTGTHDDKTNSSEREKRKENPSTMTNTENKWERNERKCLEVTTKVGTFMVHKAVDTIEEMAGMSNHTSFKLWALNVLVHSQANVDVFMKQKTDVARWEWLEFEHELATTKHDKGSREVLTRPPTLPNWRLYYSPTPYYVPPPPAPYYYKDNNPHVGITHSILPPETHPSWFRFHDTMVPFSWHCVFSSNAAKKNV